MGVSTLRWRFMEYGETHAMANNPTVTLTQQNGYQFLIDFGLGTPDLLSDEPAPLGSGAGPTPSRLLLAGIPLKVSVDDNQGLRLKG